MQLIREIRTIVDVSNELNKAVRLEVICNMVAKQSPALPNYRALDYLSVKNITGLDISSQRLCLEISISSQRLSPVF
jgi:hypothetical protein